MCDQFGVTAQSVRLGHGLRPCEPQNAPVRWIPSDARSDTRRLMALGWFRLGACGFGHGTCRSCIPFDGYRSHTAARGDVRRARWIWIADRHMGMGWKSMVFGAACDPQSWHTGACCHVVEPGDATNCQLRINGTAVAASRGVGWVGLVSSFSGWPVAACGSTVWFRHPGSRRYGRSTVRCRLFDARSAGVPLERGFVDFRSSHDQSPRVWSLDV